MSQPLDRDALCVNTIRTLSIDGVQKANSGHPGLPLGAAPMAYALWSRHLQHDPQDPAWPDRDRFVLSAGHGSMLLYSLLHLFGYDLPIEELKNFRQWGSKTPGHPEFGLTPGVEATTGPLGQGAGNAVGMAITERFLAHRYNRPGHELVDHFTYALLGDGDMMEGVACEAASLAGHLKLGKLVYLYDSNDITLDGPASLHFSEDVGQRFESYGWHVQTVGNGDGDLDAIDHAIRAAKTESTRPSLIIVRTTIGFGSPSKAGKSSSHGSPLGEEEVAATKRALGWDHTEPFTVPPGARTHFETFTKAGSERHAAWRQRHDMWAKAHPDLAKEWQRAQAGELPEGWDADLPSFQPGEAHATRSIGGKALNALGENVPFLFGGDADLSGSTKTNLTSAEDFEGTGGSGRNLRYGVREHAMGAIANGIAYHGGARTYTATFFVFSDYMRPSIRLAAMNHLPVTFVFTHDSIGLGEDGPTHQPVEHLASLRSVPNLAVVRPADAGETVEAWQVALRQKDRPTVLVFSRQNLPVLERSHLSPDANVARGGYVLADAEGEPHVILIATGSEVHLAMEARERLQADGVPTRVVSMPSWELFDEQNEAWRESVLPPNIRARVAVEAGVTLGWERYVGDHGFIVGLDRFGGSAPAETLYRELGINVDAVVARAHEALGKEKANSH